MPTLGPTELILILVIVLVLFGANRVADLGKSMGQGIREFRKATKDEDANKSGSATTGAGFCPKCGSTRQPEQRFCAQCGTALTAASQAKNSDSAKPA
ncbi:MAG: twin-arginine translocase TatA/TatE family subunit [Chloroflexi bacterium]|nr:twin-arginine translocase TatA/TatE family subunit [Chloroflexota bacterium]